MTGRTAEAASALTMDGRETEFCLDLIRELVAIESPTSHPAGVQHVLDAVAEVFAGTRARVIHTATTERYAGLLEIRLDPDRDEPGVLVLSHADTVHPVGAIETTLKMRHEGDRLYGPGVYDMKGGLVLAVAAARRILDQGRRTRLPVTLLVTPDEEVGSPVSRARIEELARANRYALVTEPARDGGKIVTARKGVGRFVLTATGLPSHAGSYHEKGASAVREIARQIAAIEDFTDYARGITVNVGIVSGGTAVNVIPETAVAEIDLRVCDAAAGEAMERRFRAIAPVDPRVRLAIEGGMNRPAFARNAGIDALFERARAIAAEIGFDLVSSGLVGGGSDGNFTVTQGTPTLDGLGVDGDGAHTNHEHMLISSIAPRSLLLQGLMERLD
jgi:glutamate carboxypeptidase